MRVVIFGASGMVGQAVLLECLRDPAVERVLVVGRSTALGLNEAITNDPKLEESLVRDLFDLSSIAERLTGLDACFFCLGVSSTGMKEAEYRRITYDLTLSVARVLAERNPQMIFTYLSGSGTDATERGRMMWARVKGATENALLRMPFRGAYMFRLGFMQPLDGIVSKTRSYRFFYAVLDPLMPLLRRVFPHSIVTTRELGRAMLHVVREGWPQPVLEMRDIVRAAGAEGQP
jgi:uncharacterized protein YbjT (DUF2867 family)